MFVLKIPNQKLATKTLHELIKCLKLYGADNARKTSVLKLLYYFTHYYRVFHKTIMCMLIKINTLKLSN